MLCLICLFISSSYTGVNDSFVHFGGFNFFLLSFALMKYITKQENNFFSWMSIKTNGQKH